MYYRLCPVLHNNILELQPLEGREMKNHKHSSQFASIAKERPPAKTEISLPTTNAVQASPIQFKENSALQSWIVSANIVHFAPK